MKKVVLTLTASLACLAAFAQGKISFQTDSLHLAYYTTGPNAGQAISSANLPSGGLMADLYMGSSSTSLFLYSSTTFSATPGKWNTASVQANANAGGSPALAPGSVVFVVAQIRGGGDTASQSLSSVLLQTPDVYAQALGYSFYSWSQEFQFTLGASISYPFMYTAPGWAPGTFDLSSSAGAGAKGVMGVTAVPEPTSMALAGLGMAAMLIFRRRK